MDNSRIILNVNQTLYKPICDFIGKEYNFRTILLDSKNIDESIRSKKSLLLTGLKSSWKIILKRKYLKSSQIIISIGLFETIFLLLLNKIGYINPRKIVWWGFFIHSKRSLYFLRYYFKLFYKRNINFVIFSECERELYNKQLSISGKVFYSLPYGDWDNITNSYSSFINEKNYYFSGGYSNRDYKTLIYVWGEYIKEYHLIIIGSHYNNDLIEYMKGPKYSNIEVFLDLNVEKFDKYLEFSKACILPFKENTGASGQMVTLKCMKLNKLIIATKTDIMEEYINNGKSGYLINDILELSNIILDIEQNIEEKRMMIKESRKIFDEKFSFNVITNNLNELCGYLLV